MPGLRQKKRVAGLLFITLFFPFLCSCEKPPPPPPEPVEVVVAPAQQKDFPIHGVYIGTTQASLDIQVRARVNGFIEEVAFTEGSLVKEGKLLYRIDNRPYKARVKRLQANTERAQAQLAKTQRDVARLEPLYEQNAASQLDLDDAMSAQEQAQASLAAALAEQQEAELEMEYTDVHAPIAGLVGATRVDLGALVGSGGESLLTTVKRVDPMYVQFHMSALDYLNARRRKAGYEEQRKLEEKGKAVEGKVKITLPDNSDYHYLGNVNFTDPQLNPNTGTFAVRATVPNPDRELLPGQHTQVKLVLDIIPKAVVIHEKSIQVEQGGTYVMVAMPDGTAERRFIVTGARHETDVVVDSGLVAGEEIISEGIHKVRHGQRIRTISAEDYAKRIEEEKAALLEESTPSSANSDKKGSEK